MMLEIDGGLWIKHVNPPTSYSGMTDMSLLAEFLRRALPGIQQPVGRHQQGALAAGNLPLDTDIPGSAVPALGLDVP